MTSPAASESLLAASPTSSKQAGIRNEGNRIFDLGRRYRSAGTGREQSGGIFTVAQSFGLCTLFVGYGLGSCHALFDLFGGTFRAWFGFAAFAGDASQRIHLLIDD